MPLSTLVKKFQHMRFEPSGWTRNSDISHADSILDYVFRWMGQRYLEGDIAPDQARLVLDEEVRLADEERGPVPITPSAASFQNQLDAPPCAECGSIMIRSGSCFRCPNCGETSGCS